MAFEKSYDLPQAGTTQKPCIQLRSKQLYVNGGPSENDDQLTGRHCWCNMTQHVMGPDNLSVSRAECIPTRECYRETY